ncbi:hypothetical protein GIB67_013297 [Kingdonia uniflora]|uniref:GrpE protein homolog n=1 Tax=Kingdonia uniflora TaxID=39325 RepID=A0A7J7LQL7_9MAGN|nr:hypothetical protein GIB67_013297 [Kingdonia uniflora]
MLVSRVSRAVLNHCRVHVSSPRQISPIFTNSYHSIRGSLNQWSPLQTALLNHPVINTSAAHQFWYSSSASPQHTDKEPVTNSEASANAKVIIDGDSEKEDTGSTSDPKLSQSVRGKRRRGRNTKRTTFSDSDSESDLSFDDLVKLAAEKDELLKLKCKEIEQMKDKLLRSYAEIENVMYRTKREAENSKKFAIQSFAKALLDVADNLARASTVVKDNFSKIDTSKDGAGAIPLLKTLLEGVEMTEKQLAEAFKKFGVEQFDPLNEQFDPNSHHALFQVADASKPPGTVAVVLKPGYMLHDRILRPAEVGVTEA